VFCTMYAAVSRRPSNGCRRKPHSCQSHLKRSDVSVRQESEYATSQTLRTFCCAEDRLLRLREQRLPKHAAILSPLKRPLRGSCRFGFSSPE
jgi:hypothetical protein